MLYLCLKIIYGCIYNCQLQKCQWRPSDICCSVTAARAADTDTYSGVSPNLHLLSQTWCYAVNASDFRLAKMQEFGLVS